MGLSRCDPTGTLRIVSEDRDLKATLSSNVPEAMVSLLISEMPVPKDHSVEDLGLGRKMQGSGDQ